MTEPEIVHALVSLTGSMTHMTAEVGRMAAGQVAIQTDLAELKTGQLALQRDTAELKTDVAELKAGQPTLDRGVAGYPYSMRAYRPALVSQLAALATLRADVSKLWISHTEFRDETRLRFNQLETRLDDFLTCVRTDFEDVRDQLRLVAEGQTVLVAGLGALRSDMEVRHTELRDMMAFMHKDLCARIDARNGNSGVAPA